MEGTEGPERNVTAQTHSGTSMCPPHTPSQEERFPLKKEMTQRPQLLHPYTEL